MNYIGRRKSDVDFSGVLLKIESVIREELGDRVENIIIYGDYIEGIAEYDSSIGVDVIVGGSIEDRYTTMVSNRLIDYEMEYETVIDIDYCSLDWFLGRGVKGRILDGGELKDWVGSDVVRWEGDKLKRDELNDLLGRLYINLHDVLGNSLCKVLLYGSYSRGEEREDSDIDIMVVLQDKSFSEDLRLLLYKKAIEIEMVYNSLINLRVVDSDFLDKNKEYPFYESVLLEGKEINEKGLYTS